MRSDDPKPVARRQILGAGAAGAALVLLPEGCGSASGPADAGGPHDSGHDAAPPDARDANEAGGGGDAPTDAGSDAGSCAMTSKTLAVNIAKEGIMAAGTAAYLSDNRYSDPACSLQNIIVIHPATMEAYVALSGACTHACCAGKGFGPTYYAKLGPPYLPTMHEDVLFCGCHGSAYNALDGSVIQSPAFSPLQKLDTCEASGFVFVTIP